MSTDIDKLREELKNKIDTLTDEELCNYIGEQNITKLLFTPIIVKKQSVEKEKRYLELVGRKFKDWTVIDITASNKALCRCSCGTYKEIAIHKLLNDTVLIDCGHANKVKGSYDLTAKCFKEWTVLKHAGNQKWICQCSCGNLRNLATSDLLRGFIPENCDHNNITPILTKKTEQKPGLIDITGQQFGKWTVIKYDALRKRWLCRCSCGQEKFVPRSNLLSGNSKSCGCSHRKKQNV